MGQIIKAYLGLFLVLLILISGVGIIFALFDVLYAQSFLASAVADIESADWDYEVVKNCFEEADEKGYEMDISLNGKDVQARTVHQITELPADLSGYRTRFIHINYRVRFLYALASINAQMGAYTQ